MTATLKIKNNCYYAVINYKEGTKYKQKWISLKLPVKNNKRKAESLLEEVKKLYEEGAVKPPDITSFNPPKFVDYVKVWLEDKRSNVETSTWEGYQIYAEKHIVPYFAPLNLKINEVKAKHIQDYYQYKFTNGRLDNKSGGLSIPSLKKHKIVLKEIFDSAQLNELIDRNPAVGVKLPAKDTSVRKEKFLTADEANTLLKAFDGHPLQALVYVTLYYGLRRSEVLGLRWSAIDFKNNTLSVNHTVVKNKTIVAKDKTKTQSSFHTYTLIEDVRDVLQKEYSRKQELKKKLENAYKENDYVFSWDDGTLFRPDYVTRSFQRVLKKHNLPQMRFHDLRHSTASILYDMGWTIKDIQTWLRHSSIEVTSDIYTHITEDRKAKMATELNSTFKI